MAIAEPASGEAMAPMTPREFEEIRQLAHRTFGLNLKPGKEGMVAARLQRLMRARNFHTFHEYYRYVMQDLTGQSLTAMIDALTTNHTAFLRDRELFDFFREQVASGWLQRESVEVWCAASATGEEVWSLACLLNDSLPSRSICIHATDISSRALGIAQTAEYPADRCKVLPGAWLSHYFIAVREPVAGYRFTSRIRRLARFRRLNLIEPFYWPRLFPAIFCRNVMIYFDRETQEQVVARMTNCLEPGGYLFVGQAESMASISHSLEYVRPAVYRKPGGRHSR